MADKPKLFLSLLASAAEGQSAKSSRTVLATAWIALVWLPLCVLAVSGFDYSGPLQLLGALVLATAYSFCAYGALNLLMTQAKREEIKAAQAQVQSEGWQERIEELEEARAYQDAELETGREHLEQARKESYGLRQELSDMQEEMAALRQRAEEEIASKAASLSALQVKLQEVQETLKRRNKRVSLLEQTARDLNYQLRTVLRLGDLASVSPVLKPRISHSAKHATHASVDEGPDQSAASLDKVASQYDAYILLHRCLQMAQALTGRYRLDREQFRSMAPTSHLIDLRRLFDRLRAETAGGILVYSRDERRLLFANEVVQGLLGWSTDKLIQDFSLLVRDEKGLFEEQLHSLQVGREAALRLSVRAKSGGEVRLRGCAGIVPSGAFQGLLIAIVYSN